MLALIQEHLDHFETRDAAVASLVSGGVAAAPVLDIGEVIAHPHLRYRHTIEMIEDPVLGSVAVPGPPFRLSRSERVALADAPELGADNERVFREMCGLSEDEVRRYVEAGALLGGDVLATDG